MDWKLVLEWAGIIVGLIGVLIVFIRRMDQRFSENHVELAKIRQENTNNYHLIDKRIHGVEVATLPYQRDIDELKKQYADLIQRITDQSARLSVVESNDLRHESELKAIRKI